MADTYETKNNDVVEGQIPSNDLWPTFGVPQFSLAEDIAVECDDNAGLAAAVLEEYGIEYSDVAGVGEGGSLRYMDIKKMDAMTVINWSLMEAGAERGRSFIEPVVNPEGEVEFRQIGSYDGLIDDIYYEILTGSFTEKPKAVMVTGGRPLAEMKPLVWYPIWGESPVRVYTAQDMLANCRKQGFVRHATIVFNDPQLTTAYNDRIDNLYEIGPDNPWDRVIGYAKYINPGDNASKDTTINYASAASIPIQIGVDTAGTEGPDMGTLVNKPEFNAEIFDPACWQGAGQQVVWTDGVRVDIPEEFRYTSIREVFKDKFIKISGVYAVGPKIDSISVAPINMEASSQIPTKENAKLYLSINDADTTTTKLEEGKHYAVAYEDLDNDGQGKTPYIVFVKDVRKGDPFDYGKDQTFYVEPTCEYAITNNIGKDESKVGTIFPHTKLKGILVQQLWVTVELETPSINIFDPGVPGDANNIEAQGAKALDIAMDLEYYIAPMVMVEPPAPIAYAGPATGGRAQIVDQVPTTDNDPTTSEDFSDKEIEIYMDEMQGGGMAITWSFLDEDTVEGMADMLYEHFQSDVVETIYTCGPDCNPILGGYGERDGVVNAIRYNYTDSGSYTVSVTEGPRLFGNLSPVDGGPSQKMAENFGSTGVVVDQVGDNIHFKVRIDGYGERWALNMAHNIVRKGDVVQVTVHNNPVEA